GSNTLTVASGSFAGSIEDTGGALALLKMGGGKLILSGNDSYRGGTMVDDGTLVIAFTLAMPEGTSLIVGAHATLTFDSSQAVALATFNGSVSPVPEPGMLALLGAGAIALLGYALRRNRIEGGKTRWFLIRNISIVASFLPLGAALSPTIANAQDIYVANYGSNTIGEYTTSGGT